MRSPVLKTPRATAELPLCPRATSLPRKRSLGGIGIRCSVGGHARSTSYGSRPYAPCAKKLAASFRQPSPIIIRDMVAITPSSSVVRSARSAAIATTGNGRSTPAAIALRSATTACRSIRSIRSIRGGRDPARKRQRPGSPPALTSRPAA
jgi:hypothetical protein